MCNTVTYISVCREKYLESQMPVVESHHMTDMYIYIAVIFKIKKDKRNQLGCLAADTACIECIEKKNQKKTPKKRSMECNRVFQAFLNTSVI